MIRAAVVPLALVAAVPCAAQKPAKLTLDVVLERLQRAGRL